jgi:hypothetical protein
MERGTTYSASNDTTYETLDEAIAAGKREYSREQNKAHGVAVAVEYDPAAEGFRSEALPAGHPVPAGYSIVARNVGGKWRESKSAVEALLDQQAF